jgi:hypothetical protein
VRRDPALVGERVQARDETPCVVRVLGEDAEQSVAQAFGFVAGDHGRLPCAAGHPAPRRTCSSKTASLSFPSKATPSQ